MTYRHAHRDERGLQASLPLVTWTLGETRRKTRDKTRQTRQTPDTDTATAKNAARDLHGIPKPLASGVKIPGRMRQPLVKSYDGNGLPIGHWITDKRGRLYQILRSTAVNTTVKTAHTGDIREYPTDALRFFYETIQTRNVSANPQLSLF